MLQFILGRAGFGKTYTARKIIANKVRSGEKNIMLLVPEQYSFENEKAMLNILGPKLSTTLEIVNFTRLCDFVFKKIGGDSTEKVGAGGRNILMHLAIESVENQLHIYKKSVRKPEFTRLMSDMLSEFRMCGVSPDTLDELSVENDLDIVLQSKLKEISLIMRAYDAMLKDEYIDELDDLTRLYHTLIENDVFKDYTFVVDGFNGFTVQELKVLECILTQSSECYITMCTTNKLLSSKYITMYDSVNKTVREITNLAKKNFVQINPPIELTKAYRFCSEDLFALEKNLYQNKKEVFADTPENISIYRAKNMYDECDFVARTIKRLVIEHGLRYKDFTVIANDISAYEGIIERAFKDYSVLYFMDKVYDVYAQPLIRFVLAAFDVINSHFRSSDIMKLLKTRLLDISDEEISELENYIFTWDIDGKEWTKDFTSNPDGFGNYDAQTANEKLAQLNAMRKKIVEPLIKFHKATKGTTGDKIAKAIYNLLDEMKIADNIEKLSKKFSAYENENFSNETERIWDLLIDILDKMYIILKDKSISPKRFYELLKIMINFSDIAFIPAGIDEVKVGSAARIRPDHPRVVFVIGAQQGIFPQLPTNKGAFSNTQRKQLISKGLHIHDDIERAALKEKFVAYSALTATSEKLFVSYFTHSIDGNTQQPSSIISEVKNIFPEVPDTSYTDISNENMLLSKKIAFNVCAKHWDETSELANTLKKYFYDCKDYTDQIKLIENNKQLSSEQLLSEDNLNTLFKKNLKLSASQIEKFYLCKFQYFCRYILKAKARNKASLNAIEYGNVMHFILEKVLSSHPSNENLPELISIYLREYVDTHMGGFENKTARFKYLYEQLESTAQNLITHILKELSQSEFKPVSYELEIKENANVKPLTLQMPTGEYINIEGKIDRVDMMEHNGVKYLRIVDYKTGTKKFKLSDVLEGLNMQMLLYLAALTQNKSDNIVPAGVLYMPSSLPIINVGHDETQKITNKQMEKFKMNGVVLDDSEIVQAMENEANGVFIPAVMENGQLKKSEALISLSNMGKLLKKVESLVIDMVRTMQNGDISADPAKQYTFDVCDVCDYAAACHKKLLKKGL